MASNSAMDRRFEISSQRLKQKEAQQLQQEQEGLKRRFAATGSLGSGASIKAESVASEASNRRLSEGQQQIEFAKLGEEARQEDITSQRAFQTGERVGGQEFAGGQAAIGRKFAAGESKLGRDFAGEQSQLGRDFTAGESKLGRDFAGEQARKAADEGRNLAIELQGMKDVMTQKGIDIQLDELEISKLVSLFNMGGTEGDRARKELAKLLGLYAVPTAPIVNPTYNVTTDGVLPTYNYGSPGTDNPINSYSPGSINIG